MNFSLPKLSLRYFSNLINFRHKYCKLLLLYQKFEFKILSHVLQTFAYKNMNFSPPKLSLRYFSKLINYCHKYCKLSLYPIFKLKNFHHFYLKLVPLKISLWSILQLILYFDNGTLYYFSFFFHFVMLD